MGESPLRTTPRIRVLLDEVFDAMLSRDLMALLVHAANGHADAQITVVARPLAAAGVTLDHTVIAVQLDDEDVFRGTVTEAQLTAGPPLRLPDSGNPTDVGRGFTVDSRVSAATPLGDPPTLILYASGPVTNDTQSAVKELRFGAEILGGSVRRRHETLVADCVCSTPNVRVASRVVVQTSDEEFSGALTVAEVWLTVDSSFGLRTRFLAEGLVASE